MKEEKQDLFNTCYYVTLKKVLDFEIKSFLGRHFFSQKPNLKFQDNFLHLGSGSNIIPDWINADFFALKFWNWKKYTTRPDWMLDIRYPLNCDDNVWDGVFSEHTLEHLYPVHARQLIAEIYRTMKPGAWLRIAVPDLSKYVDYYVGKTVDKEFIDNVCTGCEAIRALTQDYTHLSVWDRHLMTSFLQKAGFVNVKEVAYRQGTDNRLLHDQMRRKWESLYVEAQKPEV